MKKEMFALLVVVAASTCASAAFTFTESELLGLTQVGGTGLNVGVTPAPTYYLGGLMSGIVGYECILQYLGTIEYGTDGIDYGDEEEFALTLINDDDDETHAWLFIDGSATDHLFLPKKTPVTLTMDIPDGTDEDSMFGFGLENMKDNLQADAFHVSANPVPAPAALLLGGLGTLLVGRLRRRMA